MNELTLFIIVACAITYWWYGTKNREIALIEAKRLCERDELQFLDQTVEFKRQWVTRDKRDRWCYCRLYFFEFTSTGESRSQGRIVIVAGKVVESNLDAYRID